MMKVVVSLGDRGACLQSAKDWIVRQQIDVVCYAKAILELPQGPSFPPPTPSSGTMIPESSSA